MKQVKGFSLIELVTVVAIIGILAAIAYPMYQNYTIRAACDNGKAGLLQADALMNQLYTKYGIYNNKDITDNSGRLPGMETIPIDGSGGVDFIIGITTTATTYTITATTSSTGRLKNYSGSLTINEKGQRGGTLGGKNVWADGCSAL